MTTYGKVVANKLWFKDGDTIRYVFHGDTVVIKDSKVVGTSKYLYCFVPSYNQSFWILAENIHAK